MTISMYEASIPVFVRALNNLIAILEKAQVHAEMKNIDPGVLLQYRLYPDMFPLVRQVQIVSDIAKAGGARLAGQEPPRYEDDETTFAELVARLQKTVAFLSDLTPELFEEAQARTITWPMRGTTMSLEGRLYLLHYVLPNLFFHTTTSYAILRHCGVVVGKQDVLGKFQGAPLSLGWPDAEPVNASESPYSPGVGGRSSFFIMEVKTKAVKAAEAWTISCNDTGEVVDEAGACEVKWRCPDPAARAGRGQDRRAIRDPVVC